MGHTMGPLLLKKITLALVYAGYVTFYNPIGRTLACPRHMGEPEKQWKWDGKREGVAHRWLPCGSQIYVRIANRTVKTVVLDRGPYMAVDEEGKWHNASPPKLRIWWKKHFTGHGQKISDEELDVLSRTLPEGWRWRSVADLLHSLKPKLGVKGGRQPGQILVEPDLWDQIKDLQPANDSVILPGLDP